MPTHRIVPPPGDRLRRLSPFGLGHTKPKHFRDMVKAAWDNRALPELAPAGAPSAATARRARLHVHLWVACSPPSVLGCAPPTAA